MSPAWVPRTLEGARRAAEGGDVNATAPEQHAAFERGVNDGRNCRRFDQPIPALQGDAYAVGFLFGYRAERRTTFDLA
jgi:hypothetical protein